MSREFENENLSPELLNYLQQKVEHAEKLAPFWEQVKTTGSARGASSECTLARIFSEAEIEDMLASHGIRKEELAEPYDADLERELSDLMNRMRGPLRSLDH